jgi:LytS/YehU family sensor histidine kinase
MENLDKEETTFAENIKLRIKENLLQLIGFLVGSIAGFSYYAMVGCTSGTCGITSNPWLSVLWGGIAGYLIADLFKSIKSRGKHKIIKEEKL